MWSGRSSGAVRRMRLSLSANTDKVHRFPHVTLQTAIRQLKGELYAAKYTKDGSGNDKCPR